MRRPRGRPAAAGFTLLEIAAVIAILSILVSLAVPVYSLYVYRAREAEALVQLETIAYLQEVRVLERGAPIALPANPPEVPSGAPARFERHPDWVDLGLRIEGPVYFSYRVELTEAKPGEAPGFVVHAEGDVDGDGAPTRYVLRSEDLDVARREVVAP